MRHARFPVLTLLTLALAAGCGSGSKQAAPVTTAAPPATTTASNATTASKAPGALLPEATS
ncbi:MAG: hypothetical protein QOG81_958, partial [Gaiellaceae bacterium]|nr:hypothetical protein [Gaiellaceae bacterium]